MDVYKLKYLKYKLKYALLKNQLGSGFPPPPPGLPFLTLEKPEKTENQKIIKRMLYLLKHMDGHFAFKKFEENIDVVSSVTYKPLFIYNGTNKFIYVKEAIINGEYVFIDTFFYQSSGTSRDATLVGIWMPIYGIEFDGWSIMKQEGAIISLLEDGGEEISEEIKLKYKDNVLNYGRFMNKQNLIISKFLYGKDIPVELNLNFEQSQREGFIVDIVPREFHIDEDAITCGYFFNKEKVDSIPEIEIK